VLVLPWLVVANVVSLLACVAATAANLWELRRQRQRAAKVIIENRVLRLALEQLGWTVDLTVQDTTADLTLRPTAASAGATVLH
jgi:hypothetical protein